MAKVVIVSKKDGRVVCDTNLDYLFSTLRNGTYTLTIKRANEKRSVEQNDLMWMWFSCIERETGTPKDDIYEYYKKKFLIKVSTIGERMEKVYGSTSKLNQRQMSEFLDKVRVDALTELGIQLPVPEDRYFEDFYQNYNF